MATITCDICPRLCQMKEGETGFCKARLNSHGINKDVLSGKASYFLGFHAYDLFWDLPVGSKSMLIYPFGCNLQCRFCSVPYYSLADMDEVICSDRGLSYQPSFKCAAENPWIYEIKKIILIGGEPSIHPEFIQEVVEFCRRNNIRTGICTNGFMSPWVAEQLAKSIDDPRIGLKGSLNRRLYSSLGADPEIILDTIKTFWKWNKRLTLANMVDPSLGDTEEDAANLAVWIRDNLSPDIPIGFAYLKTRTPINYGECENYVSGENEAINHTQKTIKIMRENGLSYLVYQRRDGTWTKFS